VLWIEQHVVARSVLQCCELSSIYRSSTVGSDALAATVIASTVRLALHTWSCCYKTARNLQGFCIPISYLLYSFVIQHVWYRGQLSRDLDRTTCCTHFHTSPHNWRSSSSRPRKARTNAYIIPTSAVKWSECSNDEMSQVSGNGDVTLMHCESFIPVMYHCQTFILRHWQSLMQQGGLGPRQGRAYNDTAVLYQY